VTERVGMAVRGHGYLLAPVGAGADRAKGREGRKEHVLTDIRALRRANERQERR
jgi:hypothetical protein